LRRNGAPERIRTS